MYDGSSLVNNAVANGKPFVFVAVNYRVGGFGFLAGKEILKGSYIRVPTLREHRVLGQWLMNLSRRRL